MTPSSVAVVRRPVETLVDPTPARLDRRPFEIPPPSVRVTTMAPWRFRKVVAYIESHLDRRIRLSDLAALTGLSAGHLNRTFKATVDVTPQGFIRQRRIERAKALLMQSDLRLAQIAQDCGFADQAHFTRKFRDLVGLPPNRWRRRVRAGRGS